MAQRAITLAFLRPDPNDWRVNRLIARSNRQGICHAELLFDGGLAFSIYHDTTPFLRWRTMRNPGYELVSLSVSQMEYNSAMQFCRNAVAEAYRFDHLGMYLATLHPGNCMHRASSNIGKTFCSKIIAEALQFADTQEVQGLCPSSVTPCSLYEAVKDSERRVMHSVRPLPNLAGPLMMMPK